jgi:hypothetical protein
MKWHDNEAYTSLIVIIIGCALFLLLTGCGSIDTRAHDEAWLLKQRFTYEPDVVDTWRELPETGAVSGDCDDYAVTLKSRYDKVMPEIEPTLWYADTLNTGKINHIVVNFSCGDGHCIADNNGAVYRESHYPHRLLMEVPDWHVKLKHIALRGLGSQ